MDQHFIWPIRVYYEDTDAGGIVNHGQYLHFLERARTEWLRNLGFEQDILIKNAGVLFVVRRLEIEYLRPAHFNERILIHSKVLELRRVSLTFNQEARLEISDVKLIAAKVQVACINTTHHRPHPIPEPVLKAMRHE